MLPLADPSGAMVPLDPGANALRRRSSCHLCPPWLGHWEDPRAVRRAGPTQRVTGVAPGGAEPRSPMGHHASDPAHRDHPGGHGDPQQLGEPQRQWSVSCHRCHCQFPQCCQSRHGKPRAGLGCHRCGPQAWGALLPPGRPAARACAHSTETTRRTVAQSQHSYTNEKTRRGRNKSETVFWQHTLQATLPGSPWSLATTRTFVHGPAGRPQWGMRTGTPAPRCT
jgi:hypothetical protein